MFGITSRERERERQQWVHTFIVWFFFSPFSLKTNVWINSPHYLLVIYALLQAGEKRREKWCAAPGSRISTLEATVALSLVSVIVSCLIRDSRANIMHRLWWWGASSGVGCILGVNISSSNGWGECRYSKTDDGADKMIDRDRRCLPLRVNDIGL